MIEIKKILFLCDFTENSTKIVPYVLSVAEKYNSMIYLLHVTQDLHQLTPFPFPTLDASQKELEKTTKKLMDKTCDEYFQGYPNFKKMILSGHPALEILEVIESEDIDLVIMGTHGRKGLEHVIFGSAAENVVKKSPVPVLTINPYKFK